MEVRCPDCGEDNPARARFCLSCGRPLQAAEPAAEVRKTVTVLFADMVGFTTLSERLDSESLRRGMARVSEARRAASEAQGGPVANSLGDAVMPVWGQPAVRED